MTKTNSIKQKRKNTNFKHTFIFQLITVMTWIKGYNINIKIIFDILITQHNYVK